MMKPKTKRKLRISLISLLAVLILLAGGFYIYTLDYYRADDTARQTLVSNSSTIKIQDGMTVFYPPTEVDMQTGFIFYPGGKVEAQAYAPLLQALSGRGITSVLIPMPFNLAVFGVNKADRVFAALPGIRNWYLGGHSLGGAMASSYAGKHAEKLSGLILLGAYPLNNSGLPTLAVYGTYDNGLDTQKLRGAQFIEIKGGNHANFGNYGRQKGDGTALITQADQQAQAVDAIVSFMQTNTPK
jgi:hypothetical protein